MTDETFIKYTWYREDCDCIDCYACRKGIWKNRGFRIMHEITEEKDRKAAERFKRKLDAPDYLRIRQKQDKDTVVLSETQYADDIPF